MTKLAKTFEKAKAQGTLLTFYPHKEINRTVEIGKVQKENIKYEQCWLICLVSRTLGAVDKVAQRRHTADFRL